MGKHGIRRAGRARDARTADALDQLLAACEWQAQVEADTIGTPEAEAFRRLIGAGITDIANRLRGES